jgi:hypothetical protein
MHPQEREELPVKAAYQKLVVAGLVIVVVAATAGHGGHVTTVAPSDPAWCVALRTS